MSEETPPINEVEGSSFLTKGSIVPTLIAQLTAEEPTNEASSLKQLLVIRQVCDIPKQIEDEVNSTEPGTLGKAIYDLARDKTNDLTRLPAARRLHFTQEDIIVQAPVTGVVTEGIPIKKNTDLVAYRHSKPASFEVTLGNVKFKKQMPFYYNVSLDIQSVLEGTTNDAITWRSNDSVSGRTVVVPVYLRLINNQTSPASVKLISLGEIVFFSHDVEKSASIQYHHNGSMRAMDSMFQYGYFDEIEVFITRSSWVAVRNGKQDKIVMKNSETSNYLEIIEL